MNDLTNTVWAFGGPLAGAPEAAWTILAVAAGLCALFAWVSYRHSVGRLGVAPSALLMLLRSGFLVTLLFCLANPVRVERHTAKPPEPPPPPPPPRLSVVVDRSDSMTMADNRGRSRLDDALGSWRRIEKTAQKYFGTTQYFSFAEDLRPAATFEEALTRTGGTGHTRLYQSISALLKNSTGERPDAIVVLTDGVDTSTDSETLLRESAIAAGVPVYFVVGNNRAARPDPYLRVREWRVPPTAMRSTEFTIEATFEAFSRADRTVPFSLWQAGRRLLRGELALTTGSNVVTRGFTVAAGEPGAVEFALRIGAGDDAPLAARAVTQVLAPRSKTIGVLVHQGALDWGLRYFSDALRTDPSFELFTIVTPDVGLTLARGSQAGKRMLGRLPDTAAPLEQFDCVVLMRPDPRRFTVAQQQALVDFARKGGAVLVASPDADAMPHFAGGPLQALLPVLIDEHTVNMLAESGTASGKVPTRRAVAAPAGRTRQMLVPFALTEAGRGSPIFAHAAGGRDGGFLLPRFMEYVPIHRLKPGAEALAVHPSARDAAGNSHVLLAMQTFGLGRGAILTTDTLWRWKLDEPSESRAIETFWQQLILAVGRVSEKGSLRFTQAPVHVRVGEAVTLRLGGVTSDKVPAVVARSPDGRNVALTVTTGTDAESPWSVEWTPDRVGGWEVNANLPDSNRASVFATAVAEVTGELARTVPALDTLRSLAGETGGTVLQQEPPAAWRPEAKKEAEVDVIVSERRHPLWNTWTVLCFALGFYAAELLLRRLWKLL
jgi:hypothetical protein